MFLVSAAVLLSVCLLLVYATLLASQRAEETFWTSDTTIGSLYIPVLIGSGAMGAVFLVRFMRAFEAQALSTSLLALSVGILCAAGLLAVLLHGRLKRHAPPGEPAAAICPASPLPNGSDGTSGSSPEGEPGKVA